MRKYTGGCACGRIGYEYTGEPEFSFHCSCRQWQRVSGGGHTSLFIARFKRIGTTGELKFFDRTSEAGNKVSSGFWPTCGSPVMSVNSGYPEKRYIHAASVDDPFVFVPERVAWESEGQAWAVRQYSREGR